MLKFFPWLMVGFLLSLAAHAAEVDYVGASRCVSCHAEQYQQWQQSDHYQSMQKATAEFVKGNFDDVTVNFHNIKTRFHQADGHYYVDTLNQQGEAETFIVKYTFGFYPLQQYLVELEKGYIQALDIAWDSRPAAEGGQRWFHLQPEENINPEHPFFWTRYFQNWNGRCADCHSTNVKKHYDQRAQSFNTSFSDINVACESCHGPAAQHIQLVSNNTYNAANTGFDQILPPLQWSYTAGQAIAEPKGEKHSQTIDMCGTCHSLRTPLTENAYQHDGEGKGVERINYHEANLLQLPAQPQYFADGQIRDEVFVLGSFMQSKMYERGVTCNNCHNPHSGKVKVAGNGLCAQCHNPQVFDVTEHHHHPQNSTGAQCVNCHMPARTYMQVDDRRDHSFTIPRPDLSRDLGVPNACVQCHQSQDNTWAVKALKAWGVQSRQEHWAYIGQRAYLGDITATDAVMQLSAEQRLPALVRASLLSSLAPIPSSLSVQIATTNLRDTNPLVRRAAVLALEGVPPEMRWQALAPYLNDPSKSVRFEIARVVAGLIAQLPRELLAAQQQPLNKLIDEYRAALLLSAEAPSTQLALAQLDIQLGNVAQAEKSFQQALRIEPNYVPALINLADYYRSSGNDSSVEPLLKRALKFAPDSGMAQHSYGLYLIRQKQYLEALPYLKAAVATSDALPRFAYVYAVALDSQGDTKGAIKALVDADQRWPNQYQILLPLIQFLEKSQQTNLIPPFLNQLRVIAPNAPMVVNYSDKYLQ